MYSIIYLFFVRYYIVFLGLFVLVLLEDLYITSLIESIAMAYICLQVIVQNKNNVLFLLISTIIDMGSCNTQRPT